MQGTLRTVGPITAPNSPACIGGDRSNHHVLEEATATIATKALKIVTIDSIDE